MPTGEGCARLHLLLRESKGDEVRSYLREAAIRGGYAGEIDTLRTMDFSRLPENSRHVLKSVASTRRHLVNRMIMDADKLAATGLAPVVAAR